MAVSRIKRHSEVSPDADRGRGEDWAKVRAGVVTYLKAHGALGSLPPLPNQSEERVGG